MDLFEKGKKPKGMSETPLADRMRPESLEEFVGQKHILGKGSVLRRAIEEDKMQSAIFWGPPGTGKTTLARIIA
ncbi:MAG: AAA family ATPase, partial [Candidatus Zixiibacteriota bacterium]